MKLSELEDECQNLRDKVEELIGEGVITGQGKQDENGLAQPQQAYWFVVSNFIKKGALN